MQPLEFLNAHAELQLGCFFDGIDTLANKAKYAFSNRIADTFWNYAFGMRADIRDVPSVIAQIREASTRHRRTPALYLTPDTTPQGIDDFLAHDGVIDDVWMTYNQDHALPNKGGDLSIKIVRNPEEMATYLDIFRNAYGSAGHETSDVGYSGLPEEYPLALQHARPQPGITVTHFLGTKASMPVAIASTYAKPGEIGGLYNVGVLHDVRQHGLGKEISRYAINHAIEQKCKTIFLQTVPDSPVEKLYSKVGFTRAFLGKIVNLSN